MRLLIHGLNYAPEMVGIGKYTSELAAWFSARGHQVVVHTARPYYPQWREFEDYDPANDHQILNGVEVHRHAIFVPENPSGMARLRHHVSWLMKSRSALLRSAKSFDPDIVLSIAPSLIGSPAALEAARVANAKSVLHIQDFEVGAASAAGLIKSKALLNAASWVEQALMKRFDYVTSISDAMCRKLHGYSIPPNRTALVRNWADINSITVKPTRESAIRNELNLGPDKTVLLYSGTITNKQGLEVVVDAAKRLADRDDLVFLIYGEGPLKANLQARAEGSANIRFGSFVPEDQLGDLLSAADIHLLPQLASAADLVLPSKLTGMLASGRPVIAMTPEGSGLAHEVEGAGWVAVPENIDSLIETLETALQDPKTILKLAKNAREKAEAIWSRDAVLLGFEGLLNRWLRTQPISQIEAIEDAEGESAL